LLHVKHSDRYSLANRAESNSPYTEAELKKIINILLHTVRIFAQHRELSLSLKDISLEQIKILPNFVLKLDLKFAEELSLKHEAANKSPKPLSRPSSPSGCIIPLRLLISKIIFLEAKKKSNSMNFPKLKAYFQTKRPQLEKYYSTSLLDQIDELLFNEKSDPLTFHFKESVNAPDDGSPEALWESVLCYSQRKWHSLSETKQVQFNDLLKTYNGIDPLI
jgi:hypothetical protein